MFQHWLHCYKLFEEDKRYLKHVYELSYEDYIENPDKFHEEIAAFIGTRVPEPPKEDTFRVVLQWRNPALRVPERAMERPSVVHNKKYFDRWACFLTRSPLKGYYHYIARKYESEFARYGYSLLDRFVETRELVEGGGKVSALLGPIYCAGADLAALVQRSAVRTKSSVKRGVKRLLPEFVCDKVRKARQNALLAEQRT